MTKFLLSFPGEIEGAAWLLGQHLILTGLAGLHEDMWARRLSSLGREGQAKLFF